MKKLFVLLLTAIITGCGGNEKQEETAETEFFPVTSFIEGQVHVVDSFQSVTMKYITVGTKTDTALISVDEFKQIAREFTQPDFNDSTLKKYYKENSFADQSIKAVTFNYTTDNKDLEIQRVDVVVDANAVLNDKVRSIYIEKQSRSLDTFIYKKLYWRNDKNMQIITTKQVGDKPGIVNVTKVEWN